MRTYSIVSLFLLLYAVPPAAAQKLTLGAVAGTGVTGDFRSVSSALPNASGGTQTFTVSPVSRSLIIGPTLELRLPLGFSLEVDALHRPFRATMTELISPPIVLPNGVVFSHIGPSTATYSSWEFPLLARYRIPISRWRPFVEAGPSFRPAGSGSPIGHAGVTAGAGVGLPFHSVTITPALRFTRWSHALALVQAANENQVEFLVGVAQGGESSGWARGFGRRLSIGVLAGVGLGNDLRPAHSSVFFGILETPESNRPAVGVVLEVELARSLALEADGIYRPLHATDTSADGHIRFAVLTWEFPVLAKYRFRTSHGVRPFAELGPAFRADGNFNGPTPSHYGAAAGAGVEARAGRLKIAPAARYTYWGRERTPLSSSRASTFRNEVELLVGLSF